MKTHTLICAIIAVLALNIDVDPEKIKPPTGGRTLYTERDKGGGRPLAFKDRNGGRPKLNKDKGNIIRPPHWIA